MGEITSVDALVYEIAQYADTLDVYNVGSRTDPSCFICHVLWLAALHAEVPHLDEDLHMIIDNRQHGKVRCVGLLYLRFVTKPEVLLDAFEEYLLDDMELRYLQDGAEVVTTIGEYAESLLVNEKYFDSPLPRIPVRKKELIEEKVAPMVQYRKRMQANRNAITRENVNGLDLEACIDGNWVQCVAKELVTSRSGSRVRIRVTLESSGSELLVALGKVVIRGGRRSRSSTPSRSRSRGRSRSRKRSRSHSRKSLDWSRWKGKSDAEMVEELRNRLRENAVCSGHGKAYHTKRPLAYDNVASSSLSDGPEAIPASRHRKKKDHGEMEETEATRRRRKKEEDDRARNLHNVYQKYCASSAAAAASGSAGAKRSMTEVVDRPDVLRLG